MLVCDRPIFRSEGWERAGWREPEEREPGEEPAEDGVQRAMRRARAAVRDIALCTDFCYFVTLTLDQRAVDRYDMPAITRRLNTWLDNRVRRRGLAYVLVPERHKDGAIHFHGFFNCALEAVDSGTLSNGGKPRRFTGTARAAKLAEGWHVVYNLPAWDMGYTTAIELYGDYRAAVGYVCKYIGKAGDKIGGRWYYSGGQLGHPEVDYANISFRDIEGDKGAYRFDIEGAGLSFVQVAYEGENGNGGKDRQ